MALTPEDVVNKRFQPTKFREGYDQDEVDDFLDEVVVELRRLNQENEELRQRLIASESRISELQRSGASHQAPPVAVESAPPVVAAPAPIPTPAVDPNSMDPNNTNNLLQLARRLHEEHVREGVEKRDSLIAEGHATAARVVADAEAKQRAQLSSLDQERALLEHRIDELRSFEREYRQKLKGYIEGQLRDLETQSALTPAATNPPAADVSRQGAPQSPANAGPTATAWDAPEQPAVQPTPVFSVPPVQQPAPAGFGQVDARPVSYPGFGGGN